MQAARELQVSERQVRRLLGKLKDQGDRGLIHGLRGRVSNRKVSEADREKAVRILSQQEYRDFGPTLAGEYLRKRHGVKIGREALRQIIRSGVRPEASVRVTLMFLRGWRDAAYATAKSENTLKVTLESIH